MGRSRIAHNKLPEQALINRCQELGLEYIGRYSNNQRTYVTFICPKHRNKGEQHSAWYHLKNCAKGCSYCCGKSKTTEDFIVEMKDKNPDIRIVGEYHGARKKIECECSKCGHTFNMIPNALLCGQGCPECGKRISKGEQRVRAYLEACGYSFAREYSFPNCRNKHPLIFDFYLPYLACVIEFDGIQHFQSVNFRGGGYSDIEDAKKRDKIKDDFCAANGIIMIRIAYYEYDDVECILNNILNTIQSSETVRLPMAT